jgi:hypothetical protein
MANIRVILPRPPDLCVKQNLQYTICSIFRKWLQSQSYCLFTCSSALPQTYLRTTMKGTCINGRNRKRCLEKQLRMRTSTSSPSSSDAMTSTTKWVTCAGTGFLVTCSTSALNFIGNRSSLCAKDKECQNSYIRATTIVSCQHCAPSSFQRMNSRAC